MARLAALALMHGHIVKTVIRELGVSRAAKQKKAKEARKQIELK